MSYLTMQEEKLTLELQPDQKDVVMNKIRELTLSIMYKQARRYLVYFESSEPGSCCLSSKTVRQPGVAIAPDPGVI
jgi:hypothetical protein